MWGWMNMQTNWEEPGQTWFCWTSLLVSSSDFFWFSICQTKPNFLQIRRRQCCLDFSCKRTQKLLLMAEFKTKQGAETVKDTQVIVVYDWNTHIKSTLPHVIYEQNCLPTRVWMKRLLFLHEAHWQRLICSVWSLTNTKDSFITLSSFLLIFLFWAPNKIADSAEFYSTLRVDIVLQSRPAPNTGSQVFQLLPGGGSTPGRRVERGVESAENKRW